MPIPTRNPVLAAGAGGGVAASLVGAKTTAQASIAQAITFPVGTAVGDRALIAFWSGITGTPGTITGGAGGVWDILSSLDWTSYGYNSVLRTRQLTAGDLAGVTLNGAAGGCASIIVFRGVNGSSLKSSNAGATGPSLALGGFFKDPDCKAIISIVQDRDASGSAIPPGTFVLESAGVSSFFRNCVADITNPSNYVDGSTVTWTGFTVGNDQVGWLVELT